MKTAKAACFVVLLGVTACAHAQNDNGIFTAGLSIGANYVAMTNLTQTFCPDDGKPTSVLGDDNQSLKYIREDGHPKRLGREWMVSTTGEPPRTVNVAFDAERIEEAFPLEADEHYWLSVNDTAYLKRADLGSLKAQFNGVPLRGGMTFTIVAAKGEEQPELGYVNATDGCIYTVSAAPNPTTDGRVHLRIRLREVAGVRVALHSLDGHRYAMQSGGGSDFYSITVTLPGEGVWVATVESGKDKRSYKLISK